MNKKKKNRVWRLAFVALAILVVLAYFLFPRSELANYDATTVKTGNIATYYSFSGNVSADIRETYIAQMPMEVNKVYFQKGDAVEEDDTILSLTGGRKIKTSIDGTLIMIDAQKGENIPAGRTLYDIVDLNSLQILIKVDEGDLSAVSVGNKVDVHFSSLDGKIVAGTVTDIASAATVEKNISYFIATVSILNDKDIRIGMSAEVQIQKASVRNVLTLPIAVLLFDIENKAYVFSLNSNKKLERRYLDLGINDGSVVEITGGLKDGETVYTPFEKTKMLSPMDVLRGDE